MIFLSMNGSLKPKTKKAVKSAEAIFLMNVNLNLLSCPSKSNPKNKAITALIHRNSINK